MTHVGGRLKPEKLSVAYGLTVCHRNNRGEEEDLASIKTLVTPAMM